MGGAKFRAVSIVVKDRDSRASLVEAFNAWVERARPQAIVHVHYFRDPGAHTRGYQVIYEGSAISDNTPASVKGNGHHRDAVPEAGA